MQKPLMRIPYTGPLPPPIIIPRLANTPVGATHALTRFLSGTGPSTDHPQANSRSNALSKTVLLTGAGVSVASGLADYRGSGGTYTLNRTYRPIYYNEFITNHEARKRYWARSFLGWTNLHRARPNVAHEAIKNLGQLGLVSSVITQSLSILSVHSRAQCILPSSKYRLTCLRQIRCRFLPLYGTSRPLNNRASWLSPCIGLHSLP